MGKLFGIDIQKVIAKGIKDAGGVRPLVLTKNTIGTATSGNLTGGTNDTTDDFTGQGFVESLDSREVGTLVEGANALVSLIGGSIQSGVAPSVNDKVTLDGTTYTILSVDADPAQAVYKCQAVV